MQVQVLICRSIQVKMANKNTKVNTEEKSKPQKRTATVKELFQNCPKCGGDLLVKRQSEKGLDYVCKCGHKEFRKWE